MIDYSFTYEEMLQAYRDCLKNKSHTANAIKYAMNVPYDLLQLCDEVNNGSYKIGKSITFIVKFPVYREVFAADFRDRIIHHLVMNELIEYFDSEFIDESFSCRKGKGVLYGIDTMFKHIANATDNYTKEAWVLKLDIKSFFMSIDKNILADLIDDMIVRRYPENRKKQRLRELCRQIALHNPQHNCQRRGNIDLWEFLPSHKSLFNIPDDKGLAIGNLTSQIFANFYMNQLDHFIKYEIGFKHYGRYVDDLIIIHDNKEELLNAIPKIIKFAQEKLKITIHPNKRYLQHYRNGVKFIGSVLKRNRKYVINRTRGSLIHKLQKDFKNFNEKKLTDFMMVVNSYLGFMSHFNSFNIRKKILTNKKLIGKWMDYINIDTKDYKKITLKENPLAKRIHNVMNDIEETDDGSNSIEYDFKTKKKKRRKKKKSNCQSN